MCLSYPSIVDAAVIVGCRTKYAIEKAKESTVLFSDRRSNGSKYCCPSELNSWRNLIYAL